MKDVLEKITFTREGSDKSVTVTAEQFHEFVKNPKPYIDKVLEKKEKEIPMAKAKEMVNTSTGEIEDVINIKTTCSIKNCKITPECAEMSLEGFDFSPDDYSKMAKLVKHEAQCLMTLTWTDPQQTIEFPTAMVNA